MPATITLTKRICAASDGYQFLTSGFPNRSRDKKTFDTVDGLFVRRPLLPDLRPTESDIQGDTRDYFPDQPAGTVFPVWVKVERISNENDNEKE